MVLRDLTLTGRLPTLEQLTWVDGVIVYPLGGRVHRWLARPMATGGRRSCTGSWPATKISRRRSRPSTAAPWTSSMPSSSWPCAAPTTRPRRRGSRCRSSRGRWPISPSSRPTSPIRRPMAQARRCTCRPSRDTHDLSQELGRDLARGRARSIAISDAPPSSSRSTLRQPHGCVAVRPAPLLGSLQGSGCADRVDLHRRKVVGRYQFPSLVSILSPAWMPDGRSWCSAGCPSRASPTSIACRSPGPRGRHRRPLPGHDPSPSPDRQASSSRRTAPRADSTARPTSSPRDLGTGATRQLTSGRWVDASAALGQRRPHLLHLGTRRSAQRFSMDFTGPRAGDVGRTRAFVSGPAPRQPRPAGRRLNEAASTSTPTGPKPRAPTTLPRRTRRLSSRAGTGRCRRIRHRRGGPRVSAPYHRATPSTSPPATWSSSRATAAPGRRLPPERPPGRQHRLRKRRLVPESGAGQLHPNLNVTGLYLISGTVNWGVGAFRTRGGTTRASSSCPTSKPRSGGSGCCVIR